MTGLASVLDYINAGGVLAVLILLGWAFYTRRMRLGSDFSEIEEDLDACRAEIKELWNEKDADKEKLAELAEAYVKLREAEKQ